jgi:putative membrane protein
MKRTLLLLGALFLSYFFVELALTIQKVFELNPYIGYLFSLLMAALVLQLIAKYFVTIISLKKASAPPEYLVPDRPSQSELRKYHRFLTQRQQQLLNHPDYDPAGVELLSNNTRLLNLEMINKSKNVVDQMVKPLDEKAEREIFNGIRDVMIGVIFSPYRSLDVFVVLYKNVKMVNTISTIYNTRPGTAVQIKIMKDILQLALTINVMNVGDKVIENILSIIPGTGQNANDIAQGIGAGFFTSVIGFSAKRRCRNIDQWSIQEQQDNFKKNISSMVAIISKIIVSDTGSRLKNLFPDVKDIGGKIGYAVESSFEATKDTMFSGGKSSSKFIKKIYTGIGGSLKSIFTKK